MTKYFKQEKKIVKNKIYQDLNIFSQIIFCIKIIGKFFFKT